MCVHTYEVQCCTLHSGQRKGWRRFGLKMRGVLSYILAGVILQVETIGYSRQKQRGIFGEAEVGEMEVEVWKPV
jgi:hypothetical protein